MEEDTTLLLTVVRAAVQYEILTALLRQSTGLEGDALLECADAYIEGVTKLLHS